MLEKSRLVQLRPPQRNFNIFYLMAEGLSPEESSALYLNNVLAHRYVTVGCQTYIAVHVVIILKITCESPLPAQVDVIAQKRLNNSLNVYFLNTF